MLALSENPPIRSPHLHVRDDSDHQWWIAHTKSRVEKAFAWDLLRRHVPYFLPMTQRTTFSGGRKRRVVLPLFSSYVFIYGDDDARTTALMTNRLCKLIRVVEQQALTRELAAIERGLESNLPIDLYPFAAVGRRCRIAGGPMVGVEGTVVQRNANSSRLVLEVRMLGQGASVEIDTDLLEPAEEFAPAGAAQFA
jgi:transcription antitermination factor NusG